MGGAVSAGQDNNELIDNLCNENYIQTPEVEAVFRQVDRADFMTFCDDHDVLEAYEDHAWRSGKLHLSAPCIYTRAMEALQLSRGLSFLNVGSGTGYLSTMVGLLIGPYGVNHGIEIYPENIEFAQERQDEFRDKSPWYDPVNYCEPFFVVGNGLLLSPDHLLYDRMYCGAACPSDHAQLMKNMLAMGGRLVMPHGNQLECIKRVSQTEWKTDVILPSVSFAPLILPSQELVKDMAALDIALEPLPLKQYCRLEVLKHIGRQRYNKISELPLPLHLKDYVGYYKEWNVPQPSIKILCPIDNTRSKKSHTEDDQSEDNEAVDIARAPEARANGEGDGRARVPRRRIQAAGINAQPMNINGRRMLICNVNGVYFQIPIDDDDGNDSDNDDVIINVEDRDDPSVNVEDENDPSVDVEDENDPSIGIEADDADDVSYDDRDAIKQDISEKVADIPDSDLVENGGASAVVEDKPQLQRRMKRKKDYMDVEMDAQELLDADNSKLLPDDKRIAPEH